VAGSGPSHAGRSRTRLAEELWTVLERRIVRAIDNQTKKRIPIARVLDEATLLAYRFPRRSLVRRLGKDGDSAATDPA
jgi:hypothetical protein